MHPAVSVVIPAFNAAAYVNEAIDSVLQQSYKPIEVIVVDDGSEDGTQQVIAPYKNKVMYLRKERGGPSSARNAGIRVASGEWIGLLDADDLWLPDFVENLVHAGVERAADLVFSDHLRLISGNVVGPTQQERNGLKRQLKSLAPDGILLNPFELLLDLGCYCTTSAVLVRRQALLEVGLFDESLRSSEDLDLWLRLALKYRFCPVTEPLMYRRIHGKNVSFDRWTMITSWAEVLGRANHYARALPEGGRWPKPLQKQTATLLRSQGALYWDEGNLYAARESWAKGLRATHSPQFAAYWLATYLPRSWVQPLRDYCRGPK
jgi:GT2 family glycosyltransferase